MEDFGGPGAMTTSHFSLRKAVSLLNSFAKTRSLSKGLQVHAKLLVFGLTFHISNTALVAMYSLCNNIAYAQEIFEKLEPKNLYAYNMMIRGFANNGLSEKALFLYKRLLSQGLKPDNLTYPSVIKACACLNSLQAGRDVHIDAINNGYEFDSFVANSLLNMYLKCGRFEDAKDLFNRIPERTVVAWNTMIAGFSQNGRHHKALEIFDQMKVSGVLADEATMVSVLPVCANLRDVERGRAIHAYIDERGFGDNLLVRNSLIDMYAKCGCLEDARRLFNEAPQRNVISWTSMIGGYVLMGLVFEALSLFSQMQPTKVRPNSLSISILLSGCASSSFLRYGKFVHGYAIRNNIEFDVVVETALIDMYAKCGKLDLGYRLFMKTSRQRTVPWNAIISGFAQNGTAEEAVKLFKQMLQESVCPDNATIVGLIPAYANLVDIRHGMNIHGFLIKAGFDLAVEIATGLIDIYSKSGCLEFTRKIFDGIEGKDVVCYSAIIAGYGMHGHGGEHFDFRNEDHLSFCANE
ncbi:hypothetical protein AMTR_s00098p00155650 [Amborella trichopoda]|uniref:Pentacotripeptide-repeat region of PRORP domain-containing protein n=1 Tax=Amborella trichopoda TaxID=13333 RepID=W1NS59_AMBTC|nr:hypothetical protein AMTR_s00098p00155650 [Amborella trichopoda]